MESSTWNNSWPGRVIRIGTTIVLLLVFLVLGRFITYETMHSNEDLDCSYVQTTERFENKSDDEIRELLNGDNYISYSTAPDGDGYSGTVTVSVPTCDWLDNFGLEAKYVVIGHFAAIIVMVLTWVLLNLLQAGLYGLRLFSGYLWHGRNSEPVVENTHAPVAHQSYDCHDSACTCGYHRNPSRFDEEDQEWYGYCRDRNCSCVGHEDETFDEELGEWV